MSLEFDMIQIWVKGSFSSEGGEPLGSCPGKLCLALPSLEMPRASLGHPEVEVVPGRGGLEQLKTPKSIPKHSEILCLCHCAKWSLGFSVSPSLFLFLSLELNHPA